MDIFLQCKIMDQAGYGVPTIVSVYGIDAYNFSDDSITVTIPFYNKNLKDNELKVFEQIKDKPNITIYELSEKLSKTIRTIERIIVALKEKGLVNRVGSKKNGYWKITK